MSALRPHIRAARAYERACGERAELASDMGAADIMRQCLALAQVHARAAEIMEAEQRAEYAEASPVPAGMPGQA